MRTAIRVEWWKLRRSPVTLTATALMAVLLPLIGVGLYSVARNGGTGAIAAKADLFLVGEGWTGYLGIVQQVAAAAMLVGAGVVVAWLFGREHTGGTFGALFALPVSRATVAGAKFVVLTAWAIVLSATVALATVAAGLLAGVGTLRLAEHGPDVLVLFAVALLTCTLAMTVAVVASIGRGELPAIGAVIVAVAAAQFSVLLGTGAWFPFAVPGLIAVADSPGAPSVHAVQVALVPATAVVGIWATTSWWRRAEVV